MFEDLAAPTCNFCEKEYNPLERHTCSGNNIEPPKKSSEVRYDRPHEFVSVLRQIELAEATDKRLESEQPTDFPGTRCPSCQMYVAENSKCGCTGFVKTEDLLAQRAAQYGEYRLNAEISQGIKASMRRGLKWDNLKPYQRESLEMIANKLCRIVSGKADYVDSWDDIAGYATLVSKELIREYL